MRFGLGIALFCFLLDQANKYVMLEWLQIAHRPPIEVTPFFNFVMVWNYGVSFGMFSQPGAPLTGFLVAVALVIVAIMFYWLKKCTDRKNAIALGLVIGGAMGNIIDRLRFGAVADFFDFHLMGFHWPAFNIADSAIFLGVAWLVWDGIMRQPPKAPPSSTP